MAKVAALFTILFFYHTASAQDELFKVTGQVVDPSGIPLPGVNILVKGTNLGTISNADGNFGLALPANNRILIFSFIGYKKQEMDVSSASTSLTVTMEEDVQTLEGVVITGYNVEKNRTEIVGSLDQISSEELVVERPEESFEKLLAGRIAGVTISNTGGGEAGLPVSVRIRGQGTLPSLGTSRRSSSSEPLYILDGVPLYDITEGVGSNVTAREQRLNPLASLNPSDIESITVLKDASASAIYGANAANGVILITTKDGRTGGLKVEARVAHGLSEAINNVKLLNSEQYVELYRETLLNSGFTEEEAIERAGSAEVYTDWENITIRTAQNTNANLSLSGGSESVRMRLSMNYLDNETISEGNSFMKMGSRTALNFNFSEKFKADFNGGFTLVRKESLGGFFDQNFPPNISPYNADGSFNNSGFFETRPNPLATLEQNDNNHKSFATTNSVRLSYKPAASIQLRGLIGLDYYQNRHTIFLSGLNASGRNFGGRLSILDRQNFKWITNLTARWGTTLRNNHNLSALAGFEAQEQVTDLIRGSASGFPYDDLRILQVAENRESYSDNEVVTSISYFGELSYDFKQKFFISLNTRNDASSVFGGDVRRAFFASAGLSYNFHEEEFIKNISWIDLFKLRTSYGSTGNSRIGSYAARGLYGIDERFSYNGDPGIYPTTPANPDLTWERNLKFNTGLDIGLFDRMGLVIEYYRNDIKDAIAQIDVPYESGFTSGDVNAADFRNQGIELTLSYDIRRGENFNWTADFNLATNRNEITAVKLKQFDFNPNTGTGYRIGEDVRNIYGAFYTGVDPETGVALFLLNDGSLDSLYRVANDPEHIRRIGTTNPTLFGGFTNTLIYKNWQLSIITSYSFGADVLVSNFYETDGRQISFLNQSVNQLDRWQNPGDITNTPRLSLENEPYRLTNRYLYDDDFIRFENILLSYSFSNQLIRRIGLDKANVFIQCTNLGYIYFDDTPKDRNGVAEYKNRFPESRTFTAGITIGF